MENKHYIRVNNVGSIVEGWSDGPWRGKDTADAICIREDGGYQFQLWPDGMENPALFDENGIPLYKWDGETVVALAD